MHSKEAAYLKKLSTAVTLFGKENTEHKLDLLKNLPIKALRDPEFTNKLHNLLLFLIAYPENSKVQLLTEKKLKLLSQQVKKNDLLMTKSINSGLPFTTSNSTFSYDTTLWLAENSDIRISPVFSEENNKEFSEYLGALLPKYASDERHKMKLNSKYRTSERVLKKFTKSALRLVLAWSHHMTIENLNENIRRIVRNKYKADRDQAVLAGRSTIMEKTNLKLKSTVAMDEFSLWTHFLKSCNKKNLSRLCQLARLKDKDFINYQRELRLFLDSMTN
jgi:hypothetical protein